MRRKVKVRVRLSLAGFQPEGSPLGFVPLPITGNVNFRQQKAPNPPKCEGSPGGTEAQPSPDTVPAVIFIRILFGIIFFIFGLFIFILFLLLCPQTGLYTWYAHMDI